MDVPRNYRAISRVPCVTTRQALLVCRDEQTLAMLRASFPDCFEENEGREPVPFSVVVALATQTWLAAGEDPQTAERWGQTCWAVKEVQEAFQLPLLAQWGEEALPPAIIDQLSGRLETAPLLVFAAGTACVVGFSNFDYASPSPPFRLSERNTTGPLQLFSCSCIDFTR
jgi:hypothetical protein